jgi:hypothetical protein
MKLYRVDLARRYLPLCPDSMSYSDIIALTFLHRRHSVIEEPIRLNQRVDGTSSVSTATAFETVLDILHILMLFNPMRIFLPVSAVCILVGLAWGIPIILDKRGRERGGDAGDHDRRDLFLPRADCRAAVVDSGARRFEVQRADGQRRRRSSRSAVVDKRLVSTAGAGQRIEPAQSGKSQESLCRPCARPRRDREARAAICASVDEVAGGAGVCQQPQRLRDVLSVRAEHLCRRLIEPRGHMPAASIAVSGSLNTRALVATRTNPNSTGGARAYRFSAGQAAGPPSGGFFVIRATRRRTR